MPPGERKSNNFTSHVEDVPEQLSLLGPTIGGKACGVSVRRHLSALIWDKSRLEQ